jgi:hypothetical protein
LIFTISAVSIDINGIFSFFIVNYGVKTAKARGRKGGSRKFQLTKAQIAMQNSDIGIEELGVTTLTVNRYVGSTRAQVNGFNLILLITLYCAVLEIFLSHFKFQWQDKSLYVKLPKYRRYYPTLWRSCLGWKQGVVFDES